MTDELWKAGDEVDWLPTPSAGKVRVRIIRETLPQAPAVTPPPAGVITFPGIEDRERMFEVLVLTTGKVQQVRESQLRRPE